MPQASPIFTLTCPQCGRKFRGDPSRPDARYICPQDKSVLVNPDLDLARTVSLQSDAAKTVSLPDMSKTQPLPSPPSPGADAPTISLGAAAPSSPTMTETVNLSYAPASTSSSTVRFEDRPSVVAILRLAGLAAQAAATAPVRKYEVTGKLGQGGVGEVLKVADRDLEREVAMKMLLAERGGTVSDDTLSRFLREAQTTGQLEHPNIVPVHDVGLDSNGRLYFTLKYVQGLSLKQVIQRRRDDARLEDTGESYRDLYTPRKMIEILIDICQGVAFAHSKRVIHRDLKPENVMLGKFGEVLVMDWGLSKILGSGSADQPAKTVLLGSPSAEASMTMEGSVAGTPAYMSPEQAEGKISELDERTDVYALGAILFEILTGNPPFRGGSALDILNKVIEGPAPHLTTGISGFQPIPRELKAICEKAMARDLYGRYSSASALLNDLEAYLEHRTVSACPDTALQRLGKWARRNRRQVTASAISAAAVFVVIFGSWYGYEQVTIRRLINDAQAKASQSRAAYQDAKAKTTAKVATDDPYRNQMVAGLQSGPSRAYRLALGESNALLQKILDLSPRHAPARGMLADNYMALWRLALAEQNPDLMLANRTEVMKYAGTPNPYMDELNGFGSVNIALDPPDTEAYLYAFENLQSTDRDGNALPARMIPVPYDLQKRQTDKTFVEAEQDRAKSGAPVIEAAHSIFRIEPFPMAKAGVGRVQIASLAPGSYLLFLRAPGRVDTRVPFVLPRNGKVERNISLATSADVPPGFVYVAGGDTTVGGDTAGAPPPHPFTLKPILMLHDEISMGDYGEFLKDLLKSGKAAEARKLIPHDFGRPLAILSPSGDLLPADNSDPARFAKTPVRGVSYNDTLAYIAWRSKRDGLAYRLPHDWEWESVCRGADARKYSWGNQPGKGLAIVTQGYGDTGSRISWRWEDSKDESPWGPIHNMAGGAAEWTDSLYAPYAKNIDPVFGQHTIRGNAWALPPVGLECAFRTSGQPDYFHPTIGFRLALDWPVQKLATAAATAATAVTGHVH